jgi:hypothetical protein
LKSISEDSLEDSNFLISRVAGNQFLGISEMVDVVGGDKIDFDWENLALHYENYVYLEDLASNLYDYINCPDKKEQEELLAYLIDRAIEAKESGLI